MGSVFMCSRLFISFIYVVSVTSRQEQSQRCNRTIGFRCMVNALVSRDSLTCAVFYRIHGNRIAPPNCQSKMTCQDAVADKRVFTNY